MSGKSQNQQNNKNNTARRNRRRGINRRPNQQQRRRNQNSRTRRRNLATSYGASMAAYNSIQSRNGRTYLICKEVFQIVSHPNDVFDFILPFTPTLWSATRSQILASTYTGFRPLDVTIQYFPAVGSQTNGMVAFGTRFDGTTVQYSDRDSAYTALPSTNGGLACSIWQRNSRRVALGTSLRANNYPLSDINEDDIPFWIMFTSTGHTLTTQIGTLTINCRIALHNPTYNPRAPISGNNLRGNIIKDAETNTTRVMVYSNGITGNLVPNENYNLTAASPILSTANNVLSNALQFFNGLYETTSGGVARFLVDNLFASNTNSPIFTLLGPKNANFIPQG